LTRYFGMPVGNKAVQEVFAAQGFYDAQYAAVVATSGNNWGITLGSSMRLNLVGFD
jgi:hypothetical protein